MLFDATPRSNFHYTNVIGETINELDKQYLILQAMSDAHENSNSVVNVIKGTMVFLEVKNKNLLFVLTDEASYNIKVFKILKKEFKKLYF